MKTPKFKLVQRSLKMAFSGWGFRWGGIIDNQQGEWWLLGQIILISAHLIPPWPNLRFFGFIWPKNLSVVGFCLLLIGIIFIARAFFFLGASLSPLPKPKPNAELITIGSYSSCRHPLYRGLVISSAGMTIALGSILHLLFCATLIALLKGKAQREERELLKIHPEYQKYLTTTPAIIKGFPFLDWRT